MWQNQYSSWTANHPLVKAKCQNKTSIAHLFQRGILEWNIRFLRCVCACPISDITFWFIQHRYYLQRFYHQRLVHLWSYICKQHLCMANNNTMKLQLFFRQKLLSHVLQDMLVRPCGIFIPTPRHQDILIKDPTEHFTTLQPPNP